MSFAKYIALVGATLVTASAYCLELPEKLVTASDDAVYFKFCKGQFDEVDRELELAKSGSSEYLLNRITSLYTKKGQARVNSFLQNLPADVKQISEEDRIIAASYMLFSHSTDFSRMRELLSFTSQNFSVEHGRKITFSYLDQIDGRRFEVLRKRMDAFVEVPNVFNLIEVFGLASQEKGSERILTPFFKYIDQVPENDPGKYTLLALKLVATSRFQEIDQIKALAKKAYTLCKYDQSITLFYVGLLVFEENYAEAEKILTEQLKDNEYYAVEFDMFLSQIYFAKKDNKKGNLYKTKAIGNKAYFPDYLKAQVDTLGEDKQQLGNYIFFAVVGLTFVFFLMRMRKSKDSGNESEN